MAAAGGSAHLYGYSSGRPLGLTCHLNALVDVREWRMLRAVAWRAW